MLKEMVIAAWVLAALAALSVLLALAVRFKIITADLQPGSLLLLAAVGLFGAISLLQLPV